MSRESEDPIYRLWRNIQRRCTTPSHKDYQYYGGRGIKIYDEWVGGIPAFKKFKAYVGERPTQFHSLDRIDNNGNYEPGNVRWATRKEQANNKEYNIRITYEGKTLTLKEWAEELRIPYSTLNARWNVGDRGETLLRASGEVIRKQDGGIVRLNAQYTHNRESKTLKQWAEETGIPYATLCARARAGKPIILG